MNKRICTVFCYLLLLPEIAILPLGSRLFLDQPLASLSPLGIVTLSMTFGSLALCLLMSFTSLSEAGSHPLPTLLFELMVFLCSLAPLTDLLTKVLDTAGKPVWNLLVNTVFYLVGFQIAYLILLYEFLLADAAHKPALKRMRRGATAVMLLETLATLLNIPFGYFFIINAEGAYESAPTYWLAYLAPLVFIAMMVYVALRHLQPGGPRLAFLLFWLFALTASVLQWIFSELTVQYTGYTLSLVVIYVNIQSELDSIYPDKTQR